MGLQVLSKVIQVAGQKGVKALNYGLPLLPQALEFLLGSLCPPGLPLDQAVIAATSAAKSVF
jgi:hypothetical protein